MCSRLLELTNLFDILSLPVSQLFDCSLGLFSFQLQLLDLNVVPFHFSVLIFHSIVLTHHLACSELECCNGRFSRLKHYPQLIPVFLHAFEDRKQTFGTVLRFVLAQHFQSFTPKFLKLLFQLCNLLFRCSLFKLHLLLQYFQPFLDLVVLFSQLIDCKQQGSLQFLILAVLYTAASHAHLRTVLCYHVDEAH